MTATDRMNNLSALVQEPETTREDERRYLRLPKVPFNSEPVYAIPERFLEILDRVIPNWFQTGEMELERKFSQKCRSHMAVGFLYRQFISPSLLGRYELPQLVVGPLNQRAGEVFKSQAEADFVLKDIEKLTKPIYQRLEAYVGWLITNPMFRAERDDLRTKWSAAVVEMGLMPEMPVEQSITFRGIPLDEKRYSKQELITDFSTFLSRWRLTRLSTWDLPEPIGPNLGGPVEASRIIGVHDNQVVQSPDTLKLPSNLRVQDLFKQRVDAHLADWEAIAGKVNSRGLNYRKWQRVLHLHYLQSIVLKSAYGDRFRRRKERLDCVLAKYLEIGDEQKVSKLRQTITRRLQRRAKVAN